MYNNIMKMLKYILTIPTLVLSCDYFLMEDIERGIGLGIVTLLITVACIAFNQEEKKAYANRLQEEDIYSL
nr:MAG TPA: hypothetical protein [Ackermannviridae sp.]